jgi:hypothetical protein
VIVPATTTQSWFVTSTPNASSACSPPRVAIATPRYAAAGIVVTEIATPTAEPARSRT